MRTACRNPLHPLESSHTGLIRWSRAKKSEWSMSRVTIILQARYRKRGLRTERTCGLQDPNTCVLYSLTHPQKWAWWRDLTAFCSLMMWQTWQIHLAVQIEQEKTKKTKTPAPVRFLSNLHRDNPQWAAATPCSASSSSLHMHPCRSGV